MFIFVYQTIENNLYLILQSKLIFFFLCVYFQSEISPAKTPVSSGGVGSPRGMSRTSVVTLSVITALSVVYAGCSIEPQVHIIVFIPPVIKLREYFFVTYIFFVSFAIFLSDKLGAIMFKH